MKRVPPPWLDTEFEPLLRKLVPKSGRWTSDPEFWSLVFAEVRAVARDAGAPAAGGLSVRARAARARARSLTLEAKEARADAEASCGDLAAKRARDAKAREFVAGAAHGEALALEALRKGKPIGIAALSKADRDAYLAILKRERRKQPAPETARLRWLIALVSRETGRPHYRELAALLRRAGYLTTKLRLTQLGKKS